MRPHTSSLLFVEVFCKVRFYICTFLIWKDLNYLIFLTISTSSLFSDLRVPGVMNEEETSDICSSSKTILLNHSIIERDSTKLTQLYLVASCVPSRLKALDARSQLNEKLVKSVFISR